GDSAAARELYERYVDRLVALARRRISQSLASRLDPEDVVQSAFRTFFDRPKAGRFRLEGRDHPRKPPVRLPIHKSLQHVTLHKAAKRDPAAELGQEDSSQQGWQAVLAREPCPEDAIAFLDSVETFLAKLSPQDRQILEMRVHGYSNREIEDKLG